MLNKWLPPSLIFCLRTNFWVSELVQFFLWFHKIYTKLCITDSIFPVQSFQFLDDILAFRKQESLPAFSEMENKKLKRLLGQGTLRKSLDHQCPPLWVGVKWSDLPSYLSNLLSRSTWALHLSSPAPLPTLCTLTLTLLHCRQILYPCPFLTSLSATFSYAFPFIGIAPSPS